MTGNALAQRMTTVREWLDAQRPELEKVLEPQALDVTRYARMVVTACLRNTKLLDTTRESLMLSVMEAAALGLEIDAVSGLAYLVPFKGTATLIVGYRGYIQLAYRHPKIIGAGGHAIFEGDEYAYEEGDRPRLKHRPRPGPKTWDTLIATYATAHVLGARSHQVLLMWKEDIEARRDRSPAWRSHNPDTPWRTDSIAMARKTAWREHAKYIPQSAQLQRAISREEEPEAEPAPGSPPVPHGAGVGEILEGIAEGGSSDGRS